MSLITPSQIDLSVSEIAPAIFVFLFDVVFEQNYSFRPLRTLAISLPITLTFLLIYRTIKRRFFEPIDLED